MSGFSFPPPPPPPPKPDQSGPQQATQYGTVNRGGGRGRGRGRGNGRGHSMRGQDPGSRSPLSQRDGQFSHHDQRGRGDRQHHDSAMSFDGRFQNQQHNKQTTPFQPQPLTLPAGAFVNPNFLPTQRDATQAIFSNTQANQQPWIVQNATSNRPGYPPRTFAGHKRKLDAFRGPVPEKKPAPLTAPAVPSFGAAMTSSRTPASTSRLDSKAPIPSKPRPATNRLGLTPADGNPHYSSSESDDDEREVDEEAMHAELGDKLTFEHNGVVMSLSSRADLETWRRERQKKWPTQARKEEKDGERRRIGEERQRLLASAQSLRTKTQYSDAQSNAAHGKELKFRTTDVRVLQSPQIEGPMAAQQTEGELEKVKREVVEQARRLEELRRKVVQSETRNLEARMRRDANPEDTQEAAHDVKPQETRPEDTAASGDEAIDQNHHAEDIADDISESEDSVSVPTSSVVSSDSSSEDSDDEPPEEITSKPAPATTTSSHIPICKHFAASGYCRDGDGCKFRHEHSRTKSNGEERPHNMSMRPQRGKSLAQAHQLDVLTERKSLYQRLVEQEQQEEDLVALKVIKYLGQAGCFNKAAEVDDPAL